MVAEPPKSDGEEPKVVEGFELPKDTGDAPNASADDAGAVPPKFGTVPPKIPPKEGAEAAVEFVIVRGAPPNIEPDSELPKAGLVPPIPKAGVELANAELVPPNTKVEAEFPRAGAVLPNADAELPKAGDELPNAEAKLPVVNPAIVAVASTLSLAC